MHRTTRGHKGNQDASFCVAANRVLRRAVTRSAEFCRRKSRAIPLVPKWEWKNRDGRRSMVGARIMVALPNIFQRLGQGLLADRAIDVHSIAGEDELVVITLI